MKVVKVGVLGLGTVGGGVVNVIAENGQEIARRTGCEIVVSKANARDLTRPRICSTDGIALSTDPYDVINDPEIDIVLE